MLDVEHPPPFVRTKIKMAKTAIDLLEQDHDRVLQLLEQLTETTDRASKTRTDLLKKIALEFELHTQLEEEIFYPAFREASHAKDDEKLYYEAVEEHNAAALVLKDLKKADVGSPAFGGKAKVLKELISHHIDEEREEMFAKAKKLFNREEMTELAERLEERKRRLMSRRTNGAEARAH